MKDKTLELVVGLFVVVGVAAMIYLSVTLGDVKLFGTSGYAVEAEFTNTSGLKENSVVEVAGVEVGTVERVALDDYMSVVTMRIRPGVSLPEDTIASVRTKGIIGEKFIKLSPGGSDVMLADGDIIVDTEPAIDIEELISKYVFSSD